MPERVCLIGPESLPFRHNRNPGTVISITVTIGIAPSQIHDPFLIFLLVFLISQRHEIFRSLWSQGGGQEGGGYIDGHPSDVYVRPDIDRWWFTRELRFVPLAEAGGGVDIEQAPGLGVHVSHVPFRELARQHPAGGGGALALDSAHVVA